MEIIKSRKQPDLLQALNSLDKRMKLSAKEKQHILAMEKGYEGEIIFDSLVKEGIEIDCLILNDLLLTISEQTVQIDSLIITSDTVYLYEVKNYKGNYQMKSGHLLTLSGREIGNPLTQLKRTASLLRQLFQQWKVTISLEPAVIYVNSTFTLFYACPEDPIILPNQIPEHFAKMNRPRHSLTKQHRSMAERLVSEHKKDVPFQKQLPKYEYHQLKKGILCSLCGSFHHRMTQRTYMCLECKHTSAKEETIVESVEEFKLLFPELKLTRNVICDWCGESVSREGIRRILGKRYTKKGKTLGSFYE